MAKRTLQGRPNNPTLQWWVLKQWTLETGPDTQNSAGLYQAESADYDVLCQKHMQRLMPRPANLPQHTTQAASLVAMCECALAWAAEHVH